MFLYLIRLIFLTFFLRTYGQISPNQEVISGINETLINIELLHLFFFRREDFRYSGHCTSVEIFVRCSISSRSLSRLFLSTSRWMRLFWYRWTKLFLESSRTFVHKSNCTSSHSTNTIDSRSIKFIFKTTCSTVDSEYTGKSQNFRISLSRLWRIELRCSFTGRFSYIYSLFRTARRSFASILSKT